MSSSTSSDSIGACDSQYSSHSLFVITAGYPPFFEVPATSKRRVLLIAYSAVLAGARSFTAIGQWAKAAPQTALARLGIRVATVFSVRVAPSAATVRRVLNAVCPGGLADCAAVL